MSATDRLSVRIPSAVEEAVVTEAAEIHQAPPATALPERRRREGWLAWLIPVALLLLWEAAARAGWISQLLFPAPSEVLTTMGRLTASGELPRHVAISLQRVAAGLCVGAIPGITLGLAMGWSRRLRLLLDPLMGAIYPLPRIALFPLIMVLVGIGEASKVVTIGIGVFFPTLINSMTGVHGIPETYFEVARSYGARPWQVFRRVVLPGSLPTVFAGLRLAVGMALLLVIAIEFISARTGLGAFLWLAWETFRTTNVYVALLVSAFLGATLAWLVRRAEHRLLPWAEGLLHR